MKSLAWALLGIIVIISYNSAFAATAPDAPSNPSATAISSTQINIFWNAPSDGDDLLLQSKYSEPYYKYVDSMNRIKSLDAKILEIKKTLKKAISLESPK